MTADEFLAWLTPVATQVCLGYDLPAGVLVAQGAIESGWGSSKIGEFNLFGRKAVDGDKSISVETQEDDGAGNLYTITADFKDYDNLADACNDWCQLMAWGPYLQYYNQYHADRDVEAFVRGIAASYATDIHYADKILQTMAACGL